MLYNKPIDWGMGIVGWEEYLNQATAHIHNKYQARRVRARLRHQILTLRAERLNAGMAADAAMTAALTELGPPAHVGAGMTMGQRVQSGWLWVIAIAQLAAGIGIVIFSGRAEYLAGESVGRLLAVLGAASTGVQSRYPRHLSQSLRVLRLRPSRRLWGRGIARASLLGAGSGLVAALITVVPWELVSNNVMHPEALCVLGTVACLGAALWLPMAMAPRYRAALLRQVHLQVVAAGSAASLFTIVLAVFPGLVPPPLFNWIPPLTAVGAFGCYFWGIRLIGFLRAMATDTEEPGWAEVS